MIVVEARAALPDGECQAIEALPARFTAISLLSLCLPSHITALGPWESRGCPAPDQNISRTACFLCLGAVRHLLGTNARADASPCTIGRLRIWMLPVASNQIGDLRLKGFPATSATFSRGLILDAGATTEHLRKHTTPPVSTVAAPQGLRALASPICRSSF